MNFFTCSRSFSPPGGASSLWASLCLWKLPRWDLSPDARNGLATARVSIFRMKLSGPAFTFWHAAWCADFARPFFGERTRASTDSLTGAANGRVFYEILNAEIERFGDCGKPFTLAYLDVDNFKEINDQLGHAAGDQILKVIVEIILKNTRRSGDTIARMGGDEFALILSETTADIAQSILEKLRQILLMEMAHAAGQSRSVLEP